MIIVTGAAGFIGSQIALHLAAQQNEKLILVDRLKAFTDRKYTAPVAERSRLIEADQVFLNQLPQLPREDISLIIHMGAITNTAETDRNELKKWNVDYSKAIWNFCSENKINLIYASSAATYGGGEQGFSDDHSKIESLKPLNLYGQSKHEFDLWALAAPKGPPKWFGLKYFNVYGPNEFHKGPMASAVFHGFNEVRKTGSMTLFKSHNPNVKDGEQARDFIYVHDVLKIIRFLRTELPANGIYNVGTGQPGTFLELAEALFGAMSDSLPNGEKRPSGIPPKINWIPTPEEFRAAYQYRTVADVKKLRGAGYGGEFINLKDGVSRYLDFLTP